MRPSPRFQGRVSGWRMGKVEIKAFVNLLTSSQADDGMVEKALRDALVDLSHLPIRTKGHVLEVTAGQAEFELPPWTQGLLAVFYDARELGEASVQELTTNYGQEWRSKEGHPLAFTRDQQDLRSYRLTPIPKTASILPLIPLWSPLGADYPIGGLLLLTSTTEDIPPSLMGWLDLYLALRVIEKVFSQDFTYRDLKLAEVASRVANAWAAGLGLADGR